MSLFPKGATEEDIERVYLEAHKETRIDYSKTGGFFGPKLRNINHLEVGRSKVINSWYVRTAEYILVFYERTLEWLKKVNRALYPRKTTIYGKRKDAYITGKLTFAMRDDYAIPLHNMPVRFWARTWFGGWRLFAEGYSDRDGLVRIDYDYLESRRFRYKTFHFEICQLSHFFFNPNDRVGSIEWEVFERIKIPKSDLTGMGYNIGNLQLFFWEYRRDVAFPRVVINDHDEDSPEYYSDGRNDAIQQQFVPIELTKEKHLVQIKLDPDSISIPSIQADYPKNLTVAMEEKLPYSTRCDYWFGRRMMNGMNCATFLPDAKEAERYWVKYFGACDYEVNDEYAFPTVEIKFHIPKGGLPIPEEIITTGPVSSHDKDQFIKRNFTPADGDRWEQAKRVARVSGGLSTELDDHFAGTHVNTEQFSIAARRNLRKSPLATLLFPHLKEVALINHSADSILIGPGYIPKASALTARGIVQRCTDMMGVMDWKNWEPMEVINERHTYAKAENLFWEVVGEFVDNFFEEHEVGIIEEWFEVFRFSEDLVQNSAEAFHSSINWGTLTKEEKEREEKRVEYYHARFRFDPDLERVRYKGKLRAMSPITTNPLAPEPGDMENLKQACKYAIMMATFMHTWVNEHQYEDIGEILYSSLGLRFGEHKDGIFRDESDYSISPDLTRATQMMWFSNLLSRTEYGFITRNEENDIDPLFRDILEKKRSEFKNLYVEIDNIESRTNI
ncbi:lipoxygenase family protein [Algoriphagus sp. CAU 1675]|uniref:lipoxygenase family protein n=1 Tax=Algoriphagus sp. CAU 1675 TaxID=3032597 RepID=UPI0023DB3ED1|nr:lipoxygenase family protein [Algoriphagus sp. CAU 1675]MDF2156786.1 lipoxygenase family protein [Algoriphagus sp. CAU 1675]